MPSYLQILIGESALDAVPILVSNDERLVDAALRAIAKESRRLVEVDADEARRAEVRDGLSDVPATLM